MMSRDREDRVSWKPDLNSGFSVKGIRGLLGEKRGVGRPSGGSTMWEKAIPKKVNIFAWWANLGRLPTRMELARIGVDLHSTLCPRCGNGVESLDHALFRCKPVYKL
ncbi:hypothetical protein OSB04_un000953 [Centaurea solstitialis]|uniref:Reverse transcriptase zinc-binding domain-containing protein n=1 Tax=Centaurea solstitialis TaxID=347529 RepID=A0AA38VRD1_9ASTR|nr:hypothetical protein OSB04_un000953 [Centaurea solstitialis]